MKDRRHRGIRASPKVAMPPLRRRTKEEARRMLDKQLKVGSTKRKTKTQVKRRTENYQEDAGRTGKAHRAEMETDKPRSAEGKGKRSAA